MPNQHAVAVARLVFKRNVMTKDEQIEQLLITIEKKDAIIQKQQSELAKLTGIMPERMVKVILDSSYPDGQDYWIK